MLIRQAFPRTSYINDNPAQECGVEFKGEEGDQWISSAIAVGMNSLLDANPCHCELGTNQWPTNRYLSFYDGLKWRIVNPANAGPDGESPVWSAVYTDTGLAAPEYFKIGRKLNHVKMTIRANTVDIWMRARHTVIGTVEKDITSTVTGLKRLYLGKFNKMHAGSSIGCEMDASGHCVGNRHCIHPSYDVCDGSIPAKTVWGARWLSFDDVGITGGVPDGVDGACCFPNGGACTVGSPADCIAAGGTPAGANVPCDPSPCQGACCLGGVGCENMAFDQCTGPGRTFQGFQTDCASGTCPCPTPFADADGDGDVDVDDWGIMQRCIADVTQGVPPSCACFDRPEAGFPQGDGDVDIDDFNAFKNCVSGPGVTWSQALTPSCVP